jgi:polyisoprenoid-binding protein YceI
MARHVCIRSLTARTLALAACLTLGAAAAAEAPLAVESGKVTIAGTSNVHAYTAATTNVRVTKATLGALPGGPDFWEGAVQPGALQEFEIAVAAGSLKSDKEGLDKNMYKALNVQQHPDITFRLVRFEPPAAPGVARAVGVMRIAGVEREVVLDLETARKGALFSVKGATELLMTDYGIKPPKAMLGMLKTDPKVTVTFEAVFAVSQT